MSQRDVIFQCHIVAAELRGTNSDMKIGGGLRRNRGGVQRGGVRPPDADWRRNGQLPKKSQPDKKISKDYIKRNAVMKDVPIKHRREEYVSRMALR